MLSIRLPAPLELQLLEYCDQFRVTKTKVVQDAIKKFLIHGVKRASARAVNAPKSRFSQLRGSVKGGMTTEQHMRMTIGNDWNKV